MNDISAIPLMGLGLEEELEAERYQIMELLCEGGMGSIYKAYDTKTDRYVAYKSIKERASYQFELRFKYEAEVTARLEHPNIMPVYDIGQDSNGKPFYTMKLLKGKNLSEYLKGNNDRKELLECLLKVCDAIAFSHKNNIIHRDLKPENIIIGDYGEVLVLDWGIAKVLHTKDQFKENEELINLSSDLTQCGSVMGTPAYMAPEQAEDAENVDQRSDIFALGAILFKMLSGQEAFAGKSAGEILANSQKGKIRESNISIPSSALAICKKALQANPNERYQSVDDFSLEIQKLLGGFTVEAENPGLIKILMTTVKRHKTVSILCTLFAVIMVIVVSHNISRINAEKEIAQFNYQKAQDALNDLKKASPVYLDRAKHSIAIGRFDDALVDVQTYLALNNGNKEAYFLLGRINQGKMNFEEATKAFEKAQGWGGKAKMATCHSSLQISKNAWMACEPDGRIAPDDRLNIYMSLVNNMQLPEAAALLDEILQDRKYAVEVYKALFEKSGLKGNLSFTKGGSMHMHLSKENTDLTVIRHFKKAFFTKLKIEQDSLLSDIEPLSELKIRELDLSGTRVARLNQLKNPELTSLNLAASRFQNLEDLSGRTFKSLNISQCPILSLEGLSRIHADELILAGCPAKDAKKILPNALNNFKKVTLPEDWKPLLSGNFKTEITWSSLPAPIVE